MQIRINVTKEHIRRAIEACLDPNNGEPWGAKCGIGQVLGDMGFRDCTVASGIVKTFFTGSFCHAKEIAKLPPKAVSFIREFDTQLSKLQCEMGDCNNEDCRRGRGQCYFNAGPFVCPEPIDFVVEMAGEHVPDQLFSLNGIEADAKVLAAA